MSMNFCLHGSARTVKEAVARAKRAEALGFEAVFFADSQMNNVDPYQAMALCAVDTKRIRLGTGFDKQVTDWARGRIAEGAKEAGRSLEEIDVMPAGMIVVDDNGDVARQRVRSRMANRAHHNFRFTMETVPEGEAAGVKRFMDNFDIS